LWIIYLAVVIAATIGLVWGLGWTSLHSNGDPPDHEAHTQLLYLLSAQAQTLRSILAIVLTLSLVAAQMATRYSLRAFTHVFSTWLVPYVVPFLLGIVVPLLLLMGNFRLIGVRIALTLGIACVALLAPYFLVLRKRLSLEHLVVSLGAVATRGMLSDAGGQDRASGESSIKTLDNVAMGAFQAHDYDSFELAISTLSAVGKRLGAEDDLSDQQREAVCEILGRLESSGLLVIRDPKAPAFVVQALGRIGRASAARSPEFSESASIALLRLGEAAASAGQSHIVEGVIHIERNIGMRLIDTGAEEMYVQGICGDLKVLCIRASREQLGDPAAHALRELGQIGARIARSGRQKTIHSALTDMGTMAQVVLDADLSGSFRQVAFALGNIGEACITGMADRGAALQVARLLWTTAGQARLRWNDEHVNSAFEQNLVQMATHPDAQELVIRGHRWILTLLAEPGLFDPDLYQAQLQVKEAFDARYQPPPV
jgi:hypothetical protein